MIDYGAACRKAATDQGLDPVVTALRHSCVRVSVEQMGGFCMVAIVERDADDAELWITMESDGYLIVSYPHGGDAPDEWNDLAESANVREVVRLAKAFVAERRDN